MLFGYESCACPVVSLVVFRQQEEQKTDRIRTGHCCPEIGQNIMSVRLS